MQIEVSQKREKKKKEKNLWKKKRKKILMLTEAIKTGGKVFLGSFFRKKMRGECTIVEKNDSARSRRFENLNDKNIDRFFKRQNQNSLMKMFEHNEL